MINNDEDFVVFLSLKVINSHNFLHSLCNINQHFTDKPQLKNKYKYIIYPWYRFKRYRREWNKSWKEHSINGSVDVRYFPMNFPQAATPQVCPCRSARPPACSSCGARPLSRSARPPYRSLRSLRGHNLTFGKSPLGKLHIWEVATREIVTW